MERARARVLVVGEALVDELVTSRGTTITPGGSPANVATGLARLGRAVTLRTSLGDDPAGRLVHEHLTRDGVTVEVDTSSRPGKPAAPTSRALAVLDNQGRASYQLSVHWDPGPITLPAGTCWVHTGSLATVLAPGHRAVATVVAEAADQGLPVSLDLNSRTPLPGPPAEILDWLTQLASSATVVKASEDDLALLAPGQPWREVATRFLTGRTELVVVTLGPRGAWAAASPTCGGVEVHVPAAPARLVDTIGAGDTFMAALIDGLLARAQPATGDGPLPRPQPAAATERSGRWTWSRAELSALLTRAAVAASLCCERPGADPPTRAELDRRCDTVRHSATDPYPTAAQAKQCPPCPPSEEQERNHHGHP